MFHNSYQFSFEKEIDIKNLILHADDLGLSLSFNEGILKTALEGVLTSTCIRTNGASYEDAKNRILPQISHIGVGLHLNIVEGRTGQKLTRHQSALYDTNGEYKSGGGALGFIKLLFQCFNKSFLEEVEADFRNQIEIALNDNIKLDHLNSHQHSHGIPEIFKIVCRLAKEYNIPYVRLPKERFYFGGNIFDFFKPQSLVNLSKWLILNYFSLENFKTAKDLNVQINNVMVGILHTGFMNPKTVLKGLSSSAPKDNIVEVLLHPAIPTGDPTETFLTNEVRDYVFKKARRVEVDTLLHEDLQKKVLGTWHLTNYKNIGTQTSQKIRPIKNKPSVTPLKTYVILDETPFFHPEYLYRLINECPEIIVCGVARVKTKQGGALNRYMVKNLLKLKIKEFLMLGFKKIWLKTLGFLPISYRGNFHSSVKNVSKKYGVPLKTISKVNENDFTDYLKKLEPDLVISSNELIFKEGILSIPKYGCINRHSSLLPEFGGVLPVFRAIQFKKENTGVSIHRMTREIDGGEVLSQKTLPIFKGDTLFKLYEMCFELSFYATQEAILKVRSGPISHTNNPPSPKSYFSFPKNEDWAEFRKNGGKFI